MPVPSQRGAALHRLFALSLLAKGAFSIIEVVAGAVLFAVPNAALHGWVQWLTQSELIEDPSDPLARRVLGLVQPVDAATQHFYALYLLAHGVVKLGIVAMLARRVTAAYPLAIAVFTGFILYQLHRWQLTGSPAMLALSALDALVVVLTAREWRQAHRRTPPA